jgi:voltage-gated potassium channel
MVHGDLLITIEWVFTILFTIEYILRLLSVRKPLAYAVSFYGIVDLLSILPTYLDFFMGDMHYFMVIRTLRMLRIFRILKLVKFVSSGNVILTALRNSRYKIIIFLFAIMNLVVILGALMYLVEGEENGFTSIPRSIYWAVVTLTTVGYGDIAPKTIFGQFVATLIMILGYGIIAVPTGIVTAEFSRNRDTERIYQEACPTCGRTGHEWDAKFCKHCGSSLHPKGY